MLSRSIPSHLVVRFPNWLPVASGSGNLTSTYHAMIPHCVFRPITHKKYLSQEPITLPDASSREWIIKQNISCPVSASFETGEPGVHRWTIDLQNQNRKKIQRIKLLHRFLQYCANLPWNHFIIWQNWILFSHRRPKHCADVSKISVATLVGDTEGQLQM